MRAELPVQQLPLRCPLRLREVTSSRAAGRAVRSCTDRPGTCERMPVMRAVVLALIVALAGPAIGSLLCHWTCAAKHQRSEASGNCHQHRTPGSTATLAAGHLCHDLTWAPASILTDARHPDVTPAVIAEAPFALTIEATERVTHGTDDILRAPPLRLLTRLRV